MKGWQLQQIKAPLQLVQQERPELSEGEVAVKLQAAALNRRDYWITQGLYPGIQLPVILGSDGAGVVVEVGQASDEQLLGQEVVLYPGIGWGDNPKAQSPEFVPLGMPHNGTFASEIVIPKECLFSKPHHLDWAEAAALPLGGTTAYRAVYTQGQFEPGQSVLITGVGGGVSSLALQLVVQQGGKVVVTSSSPRKIELAQSLGADGGVDYTQSDWSQSIRRQFGEFDLIIDSAGGEGINSLIDLTQRGGRIVSYGATTGKPPKFDLHKLFWKQIHLVGSSMGSPDEFGSYLETVTARELRPQVDQVFSFAEVNQALSRLQSHSQMGKLVIQTQA